MTTTRGSGCLRNGLLGCGGVLLVAVVVVVAVVGTASLGVRSEKPESQVLTPDIPVVLGPGSTEVEPRIPGDAVENGRGRVTLDLSRVETTVTSAPEGEGLRVEADFDPGRYELVERLDTAEDGSWAYSLAFRPRGSGGLELLRRLLGGHSPTIRVHLPPDAPIELAMEIDRGGAELDLGDLQLRALDLELDKAGLAVEFRRPLREPMDRLGIRGSMGGVAVQGIGNASPRIVDVDFAMGGLMLDLRGAWVADAEISVNTRMAGGEMRLPADVTIVGLPGYEMTIDPAPEIPLPTLRFDPTCDLEDVEIRR